MNKTGNNHSSLLKSIEKIASAGPKKSSFSDFVLEIANKKQPTLREIFAQMDPMAPDTGAEMGGLGGDTGLGGETGLGNPEGMENAEPDPNQEAKIKLVEALIALCGSPEEAKKLIDAQAQPEAGPESGMEGEVAPTDMPAPMGEEAPAPMPMSASPMPMPSM